MAIEVVGPAGARRCQFDPSEQRWIEAVAALVQAFSGAIPWVLNEFFVLSHGREPFRDSTFLWVYVVAVAIRRRCLLQKTVLTTMSQGGAWRQSHGLTEVTPSGSKCLVLRVTTTIPTDWAIAAVRASSREVCSHAKRRPTRAALRSNGRGAQIRHS